MAIIGMFFQDLQHSALWSVELANAGNRNYKVTGFVMRPKKKLVQDANDWKISTD